MKNLKHIDSCLNCAHAILEGSGCCATEVYCNVNKNCMTDGECYDPKNEADQEKNAVLRESLRVIQPAICDLYESEDARRNAANAARVANISQESIDAVLKRAKEARDSHMPPDQF